MPSVWGAPQLPLLPLLLSNETGLTAGWPPAPGNLAALWQSPRTWAVPPLRRSHTAQASMGTLSACHMSALGSGPDRHAVVVVEYDELL